MWPPRVAAITGNWPGLGTFFRLGEEILKTPGEVLQYLREIERRALGQRAPRSRAA
jgi:hypothetical protein